MPLYLLKLSLCLALVYLFYRALLRPLTFYRWNRFFLAGFSLASFLLPLVNISLLIPPENTGSGTLVRSIPVVTLPSEPAFRAGHSEILISIFVTGILLRLLQLAMQYRSLQKLKRNAVPTMIHNARLYDINSDISPFSFAGSLYINTRLHAPEELDNIIRHEFVHVKQKHTVDLLIAELLCMANWFNPFAWLIRSAIRQNLEFIADNTVLKSGLDARQYSYLLLKVVGMPRYSHSSHFNFSSLKKRIAMINKNQSPGTSLLKFLLVLPFIALMLLAFRQTDPGRAGQAGPASIAKAWPKAMPFIISRALPEQGDTVPVIAPPPPPEPPEVLPPVIKIHPVPAGEAIPPIMPSIAPPARVTAPVLPKKPVRVLPIKPIKPVKVKATTDPFILSLIKEKDDC